MIEDKGKGKDKISMNNPTGRPVKSLTKKLSTKELLKLNIKGMTQTQLAALTGTTRQNISLRLSNYISKLELLEDPEKMRHFVDNKSKILTAVEGEILDYLVNPDQLKKASVNNLAYALQNIHNINRLEQGKATQNININVLIDRKKEIESMLASQTEIDVTPCPSSNTEQVLSDTLSD